MHHSWAATFWLALSGLVSAVENSNVAGPFIGASSMTWFRNIHTTVIGTAVVIIDSAKHSTKTTTVYHTDYTKDGKLEIFTPPTETNSAGYRTAVVGKGVTVTYPTNYFSANQNFTWNLGVPVSTTGVYTKVNTSYPTGGVLQIITALPKGGTCCITTSTGVPTSAHTPFEPETQTVDKDDPFGWFQTLVHLSTKVVEYAAFGPTQVSSMWAPTHLSLSYKACAYALCASQQSDWSTMVMSAVTSMSGMIVTTTSYISSDTPEALKPPSPDPSTIPSKTPSPSPSSSPSPAPVPAPAPVNEPSKAPPKEPITVPSSKPPISPPDTPLIAPIPPPIVVPSAPTIMASATTPAQIPPQASQQALPSPANDSPKAVSDPTLSVESTTKRPVASVTTPPAAAQTPLPSVQIFTSTMMFSSMTITEVMQPAYIVSGQTLAVGTPVTISPSGTTTIIALATGTDSQLILVMNPGSVLKNGAKAQVASSTGLGFLIQQGLGG